jgi:hypothetical protein
MPFDEKLKSMPWEEMGKKPSRKTQDHGKATELAKFRMIHKKPIDLALFTGKEFQLPIYL